MNNRAVLLEQNQEKNGFLENFSKYIENQHKGGSITQEEYDILQQSIQNGDFQNILLACSSIEGINQGITRLTSAFTFGILLVVTKGDTMQSLGGSFVIGRIIKIIYSYTIAQKLGVPDSGKFSLYNSIPFGKFVVPFVWLKDDKEAVKYIGKYFKDKIIYSLSGELPQGFMRIGF